jgi:hypothetical protein
MNTHYEENAIEHYITEFHKDPETGVTFRGIQENRVINKSVIIGDMDFEHFENIADLHLSESVNMDKLHDVHEAFKRAYENKLIDMITEAVKDYL